MNTRAAGLAGAATLALALAGCEKPQGMETEQTGFRGSGMAQVENPRLVNLAAAYVPPPPYPLEPDDGGERAGQIYQNVQVLGDLSGDEFNRLMISITEWVSPEGKVANGGCNYCHNPENMASDAVYTKVVARKMLQMTRNINANWQSHVQKVGVTCWTCHRGNPVPTNNWTIADLKSAMAGGIRGQKNGQNTPNAGIAYASLPYDPFTRLLQDTAPPGATMSIDDNRIQVASASAYPGRQDTSIKATERTYGLMMHFSNSLGVNCTYCHNSQSFKSYSLANPQKALAWYAIRMTRQANDGYITPLTPVFPANRLGPAGDPYKINCATCHQGLAKPMNGVAMINDHPALWGPRGAGDSAAATITATIPAGVRAISADATATAAQCNAQFSALLTGAEIRFDTDSATIRPESRPLLDRLSQVAGRCSGFSVAVGGHTDVTGAQATNLPLSRDRAASVANYLVGRGVQPAQLSATGYGESRPKAAGEGDGANQVNRRIEISVTG